MSEHNKTLPEAGNESIGSENNIPLRSVRKLNDVEKSKLLSMILTLRTSGVRWEKICDAAADRFRVKLALSTAHDMYRIYLQSLPKEALEDARLLQLHRLEGILSTALHMAKGPKPSIKALEVALSASKQLAELQGLDAPTEHRIGPTEDAAQSAMQKIMDFAEARRDSGDSPTIN